MPEPPDHPQLPLPPPIIFAGYLVSAFILQWAVPFPTPWPFPLRGIGGVLVVLGIALAFAAFSEMSKVHTTPDPRQAATALVTTGPYRFTRNPIYIGFLLIYLGFTLLGGTLWGVILGPFLIGTISNSIVRAEELYLERKFEEDYHAYSTRVHRWI